jgi:anti-anti-sigma regulatory factor
MDNLAEAMAQNIRPAVVLDCSALCKLDKSTMYLFFCCLEEAMKRNGDVRLAGVKPEAFVVLESAGAGYLFRNFATALEAVDSYQHPNLAKASVTGQGRANAA